MKIDGKWPLYCYTTMCSTPRQLSVIMQTHQDEHLPEDNGMMIGTRKAASIVNSSRLLDDPTIQAGFTCTGH